jgi:hypothetical protein
MLPKRKKSSIPSNSFLKNLLAILFAFAALGFSNADLSPEGKAAQSSQAWKHAESAHFIYHFPDPFALEPLQASAETYYQWVKDALGVTEDKWSNKAHVFLFPDPEKWKEFNRRVDTRFQGDAFTNGNELFIYLNPFWLAPKKTLAHELTHVIAYRFLDGPIPLSLNEGFAEFIASKAIAMHADGNEYAVRGFKFIPEDKYIDVEKLVAQKSYPQDVETFYRESEWLVRMLHQRSKTKFYELLRKMSQGAEFKKTLEDVYEIEFDTFSADFHRYAITGKT